MTEKQISKWLRRQFSSIGWILIGYYLLMNLLVSLTMALDMGKQALWNLATNHFPMDFDWETIWSNGWGYIAAGVVLMTVLYGWTGSRYWGEIWKHRERKMTGLTILAVLGLCVGAQLLNSFWVGLLELVANAFGSSMIPMLESVSGSSDSVSMFLYGAVFAPVTEELLFRGYILNALKPYGRRFAILGSAVLFGVFHGNLLQTPYAFVMGLVLGWLAMEFSLRWAVALHVFNNLVLAEGLSRLTENLSPILAEGILLSVMLGFSLAAAVILFAKRREIRAYRRGEWIDRRCAKCLFTSCGVLLLFVMMAGNTVSYFFS